MIRTPYDHIADRFHELRTTLQPKEIEYLALLQERLPAGGRVLDLGCGTGQPIATSLAAQGYAIIGVDGSEAMLAYARKLLPGHRWIHAYMQQVEFDESFDAAICWDSLFHQPRQDYEVVLRKVHRWLAPGGRVMVSSGGATNQDAFTDTMFGHEFFYDSPSPDDMVALLKEIGFSIVLTEMCDPPDGYRNKGKWATVAEK